MEWKELKNHIKPKERGFDVLFTNMFLPQHGTYLSDLRLISEEEYRFYTELRRRTEDDVFSRDDQPNGFVFNGTTILFDGEEILALTDGKKTNICTVSDFMRCPNAEFRKLMKSIKKAAETDQ